MYKISFRIIGKEAGLKGKRLRVYTKYMKMRWGYKEEMECISGYAKEWADRFLAGKEYSYSDLEGQRILNKISRENQ